MALENNPDSDRTNRIPGVPDEIELNSALGRMILAGQDEASVKALIRRALQTAVGAEEALSEELNNLWGNPSVKARWTWGDIYSKNGL